MQASFDLTRPGRGAAFSAAGPVAAPRTPAHRAAAPHDGARRRTRRTGAVAAPRRSDGLAFFVFTLINATLFIRPAEIVPGLLGLPIYEVLNLVCLALCMPGILRVLSASRLAAAPITCCVVGIEVAVILSDLSRLHFSHVARSAFTFGKVLAYYLMLVSLVDTHQRLRTFLKCLLCFTAVVTGLALLHYHHFVFIPAIERVTDYRYADTEIVRMCAFGIFGNPNDLARMLAVAMITCLYVIASKEGGVLRWLGVPVFLMMGYALYLTQSRGGLLGVGTGVLVLLRSRLRLRNFVVLVAVAAPVVLTLFAGRLLNITVSGGTGQQRIQLWAEGLALMRHSPVFGIGMNQYTEYVGLVAHNSFVHCFVELGLIGGSIFASAFYLAVWTPYRLGAGGRRGALDPETDCLRVHVMAIVAGIIVGYFSSTRSYEIPTYTVLGLSAAFMGVATAGRPPAELRMSRRMLARLAVVSVLTLIGTYLYVRYTVNWD